MNHARHLPFYLAALLLIGGCAGAHGAGAEAGPKAGANSYLQALKADSIHGAQSALVIHGTGGDAARDLFVEMMIVPRELSQVCQQKLGQDLPGTKRGDMLDDQTIDAAIAAVKTAQVTVTGKTAMLNARSRALQSVGLDPTAQPMEKSLFGWRVVLDQAFGSNPGKFMEKGQDGYRYHQQMKILEEVIGEIRSGKLKTVDEVTTAITTKGDALDKKG